MAARFIFITGGVVSSLGKGIASAALAAVLQARGYRVRLRKLDPYLNVDPGTMSPFQHGEVFVTDDGAETDLDLGHYERFTGVAARKSDNVTAGRIYQTVLDNEREGKYLGGTVQVIPHVTNAIKEFITSDTGGTDFVLCEIGGTVGDIEGLPFFEAIRQLGNELERGRACFLHLTLMPYIPTAGELKTKPTQHSVKELRSIGIAPDILMVRADRPLPEGERKKIALFCNVREECVIPALDLDTIYDVPRAYHEAGLDTEVLKVFGIEPEANPDLSRWDTICENVKNPEGEVKVAIVGKYTQLIDAYKSLYQALEHGGIANKVDVKIDWINAEDVEANGAAAMLSEAHAILVPGGFGERGTEGKIAAIKYARENKIPFMGICLGMQMACVETARNIAGLPDAGSSEFNPKLENPLVGLMTEWQLDDGSTARRDRSSDMGGTMRLGAYPAILERNSKVHEIYGTGRINERHRHRYEVNFNYREQLEAAGLKFSGTSPDGVLPEIVERDDHPWFVAVQFHPELKSKPFDPHPLFTSYVAAAVEQSRLV